MEQVTKDIVEKAKKVKAVVLDSDGVIFTGHVIEGMDGPVGKIRSHVDGGGVALLRASGIKVLCVTGENGKNASFLENLVEKWNNLPSVKEGKMDKVLIFTGVEKEKRIEVVNQWLTGLNLTFKDCAAMGDDLTDFLFLKTVREEGGFATCPAQAEEIIKKLCHFIAPRRGGDGAVRDLANLILEAKGVDVGKFGLL